jgi:hypothetical protein
MESSCIRSSIGNTLLECGERSLPEADSAIIGGDSVVCPYLKLFLLKKRLNVAQQQLVLEDPSREDDRANPMLLTNSSGGGVQPLGDSSLKCAGDLACRTTAHSVVDDTREQGAEVEFAADVWKWIRIQSWCAFSQLLQPNCSLPFKASLSDKAEQGCNCVKESSHGGGGKCANSRAYQLDCISIAQAKVERRGSHIWQSVNLGEKPSGGLYGISGCCIAPWEDCLTQVSYAFKTLLHASNKNLAAPYGPVVPISCTVKTESNDGLFPSTALGKD